MLLRLNRNASAKSLGEFALHRENFGRKRYSFLRTRSTAMRRAIISVSRTVRRLSKISLKSVACSWAIDKHEERPCVALADLALSEERPASLAASAKEAQRV
jgi:hypothetical protein